MADLAFVLARLWPGFLVVFALVFAFSVYRMFWSIVRAWKRSGWWHV